MDEADGVGEEYQEMEVDGPDNMDEQEDPAVEQPLNQEQPAVAPVDHPPPVQNLAAPGGIEEDLEDEAPWNGWPDAETRRRSRREPKLTERMKQYRAGGFEASLTGLFKLSFRQ